MIPKLRQAAPTSLASVLLIFAVAAGLTSSDATADRIEALIKELSSKDWEVRRDAVHELEKIGPRASVAVQALIRALGDERLEVADAASCALTSVGDAALNPLCEALDAKDDRTRWFAARALASGPWDKKRVVRPLLRALRDKSDPVREAAVTGLRRAKDQALLQPLLDVVRGDPDRSIRARAADAIRELGPVGKTAIPVFIEVLRKEARKDDVNSRSLCEALAGVLGSLGPEAIPSLNGLVLGRKQNPAACSWALWTLRRLTYYHAKQMQTSLAVLRDLLQEPDEDNRASALNIFQEMGKEASPIVPDLLARLNGASDREKPKLAAVLYSITGSAKQPASVLIDVSQSKTASARWNAARVVAEIGKPAAAAVPAMIALCQDSSADVRLEAVLALAELRSATKDVIQAMRDRLADPRETESVRKAAKQALEKLGAKKQTNQGKK